MINKTYPITEKLLAKGLELNQKLFALLNQEADQLKTKNTTASINKLSQQKKQLATQIEQFSQQLAQVLNTENLSLDKTGLDKYFSIADNAGFSTEQGKIQWEQIKILIKKIHHLNEQNGASISLLLRHNQRVQQIFRGQSQTTTTYSLDGTTSTERTSRTLVSV